MERTELTAPLINGSEIENISPQEPEPTKTTPLINKPENQQIIYRVPQRRCQVDKDVYSPKLISIGPFHHGNEELKGMEELKWTYFKRFCQTTEKENEVLNFIAKKEPEIRRCYGGPLKEFPPEELVKIVASDSIFIIEYFGRATAGGENENNINKELEVSNPWLKAHIMLDLILLENQIPFFILDQLYNEFYRSNNVEHSSSANENNVEHSSSANENNVEHSFFNLACKFFRRYLFSRENQNLSENSNVKHFTDLLRYIYYPSEPKKIGDAVSSVYSATKLYETGVRFEKTEEGRFDNVKLDKLGRCQCLPRLKCFSCSETMQSLHLPNFVADNRTEPLFRNIMALEQCHYPSKAYLCSYMVLLDHLINTSEDVELLVDKGIIVNALGSYQEVANMINKIALEVVEDKSYYSDVAENLKNHYKNSCNRNIGILKSTYFTNLWRGTATVVGIIILVLTIYDILIKPSN